MSEGRVALNGSGPQTIYMNTYRTGQSGNSSNFRSYGIYEDNNWGSYTYNTQYWSASGLGFSISGTFNIPQGTKSKTLYDHYWSNAHDAAGNGSGFQSCFSVNTDHSSIGDGTVCVNEGTPPRIPKVPGKPPKPVYASVSATTIEYTFAGPSDNGGSGIDQYEHQSATDSGFSQNVRTWTDNGSPGQATNLTPGTGHWIRFRAHNGVGWGPYSDALAQTTLPAVPPGFVVASSPSGTSARLTFSPPGGVTGVTKYTWERRLNGTTTPVTTEDITVTIDDVMGLTPGSTYQWRGSAWIGAYQSPWTDWLTLQQAKPNVDPGQYFDGSTTDVADINYGWTGTANNSTSTAVASGVDGWAVTTPSGTGAVLYRVTAGIFSAYAARVQITADMTAAGQLRAGQANAAGYRTEVTADATYIGSIHVRPSRGQSLAAELTWIDAAGVVVGARVVGAATAVPGGAWLRLAVGAVAPAGAVEAVVRVIDVAGDGWSVWLGGETLDLDGAMISLNEEFPYFDGNTLSDGVYVYEWDDVPNASVSTRTPIGLAESGAFMPELGGLFLPSWRALIDPDCTPVPAPPRPPVIPSDCIEDVGVWRRYYTQIPSNLVPDWMDVVPTLDIISGSSAARQVRIRYYPNPDDLLPGEVDTSSWMAEQIISFMPAHTVMTLDGVTQRVWAEINGSDPVGADHLLYGTNGRPATWPLLSCGISYLVSVEVPIKEPAGNITVEAALTARA